MAGEYDYKAGAGASCGRVRTGAGPGIQQRAQGNARRAGGVLSLLPTTLQTPNALTRCAFGRSGELWMKAIRADGWWRGTGPKNIFFVFLDLLDKFSLKLRQYHKRHVKRRTTTVNSTKRRNACVLWKEFLFLRRSILKRRNVLNIWRRWSNCQCSYWWDSTVSFVPHWTRRRMKNEITDIGRRSFIYLHISTCYCS